ncbi:MAG: hypothetical protein AABX63_02025 [Nanoarchaeota archaeon]
MAFSTQTVTASATTTAASVQFNRVYSVMLRAPSANTDDIFVNLGGVTATSGDVRVRPNETISISIAEVLLAVKLSGREYNENDFIRSLSYRSNAGTQTLYFDVLRFDA